MSMASFLLTRKYLLFPVRQRNVCNVFFLSHKDDISYNKVATQSHTYPVGAYYVANNAVDGDIATCMRTDIIGMNDPDKTLWWKVDLGGLRSIFSISILF